MIRLVTKFIALAILMAFLNELLYVADMGSSKELLYATDVFTKESRRRNIDQSSFEGPNIEIRKLSSAYIWESHTYGKIIVSISYLPHSSEAGYWPPPK